MIKKHGFIASITAAFITLMGSSTVLAQVADETQCAAASVVYHVNGIGTSPSKALANSQWLKLVMNRAETADGSPIQYAYTHNPSADRVQDLRESMLQLINQLTGAEQAVLRPLLEQIVVASVNGTLDVLLTILRSVISESLGDRIQAQLLEARLQFSAAAGEIDRIRGEVSGVIKTFVERGNRVIVVPHSQGNFVVNEAVDILPASDSLSVRIISTATPAATVADGDDTTDRWVTEVEDFINAVPGNLPSNIENSYGILNLGRCPADGFFLNHNFVGCYLRAGMETRARIRQLVNQGLDEVPLPTSIIGQGIISATLRWGAEPDVDLHAFEPNGAHVYYANLIGPSGRLDRDDVTSFGPENYTVACDTVEIGTYRIGVNYFRGSGPETANISIRAGNVERSFTQALSVAIGSAGDASPIPISTIEVSRDANDALVFTIR